MHPVECVALMLIKDHHVLAEQRKRTKRVVPSAIALPGRHIEKGYHPLDLDVDRMAVAEYLRVFQPCVP